MHRPLPQCRQPPRLEVDRPEHDQLGHHSRDDREQAVHRLQDQWGVAHQALIAFRIPQRRNIARFNNFKRISRCRWSNFLYRVHVEKQEIPYHDEGYRGQYPGIVFRIPSAELMGRCCRHYLRLMGVGRERFCPSAILFKERQIALRHRLESRRHPIAVREYRQYQNTVD